MTTTVLTASIDARINDYAPTTNYGTNTELRVGESNAASGVSRTFLKFSNLSNGTIPSNATVSSATLELYSYGDLSSRARTFRVFRQKRAWTENGITWNKYDGTNNWATAGGFGAADCEQTDIGSRAMTDTEAAGWKSWSLSTSAIQEIIAGTWTNNGFMIKADTENDDAYQYYSREQAGSAPKLTIVYTTPAVSGFQQKIIYID